MSTDSLPPPPFLYFPNEIKQYILKYVLKTDIRASRCVCKDWKDQSDALITLQWNKIKGMPSNDGVVPLKAMMASVEKANPNGASIIRFGQLKERFKDAYGVQIRTGEIACLPTQIVDLQKEANSVEDQSLAT